MMWRIVFFIFLFGKMLTYAAPLNSTKHTEVRLNRNDRLECLSNADVSENVQIKWFHNGIEVTDNNDFLKLNATNHLLIVDAEKASGKYKCKVFDKGVISSSSSFDLKPEMLRHLRLKLPHKQIMSQLEFQVTEERTFHVQCHLASQPPANMTFLHNGNVVTPNSRIAITTSEHTDGVLYELFINQVDKSDVGAYHCRASNGFLIERILSGNIYLKGDCAASTHWMCPNDGVCVPKTECEKYEDCLNFNCEVPLKPDVTIKTITHNMVVLTWQLNKKSKEYTCIVDTPKTLSQIYQTKENFLVINNLKNDTKYTVNIYAANKVGTSEDAYLSFKTRRMVPPQIVESAKVMQKIMLHSKATVTFLWFPPVDDGMENKDGELQYLITLCIHGNHSDCEQITTNLTSLDFEIGYDVLYTFGITSYNSAGQAGPTKYVFYRTGARKSSSGAWKISSVGFLILCIQLAFYVAG